jgi:hypothetical protein
MIQNSLIPSALTGAGAGAGAGEATGQPDRELPQSAPAIRAQ